MSLRLHFSFRGGFKNFLLDRLLCWK